MSPHLQTLLPLHLNMSSSFPPSWLTSPSCSTLDIDSSSPTAFLTVQWLRFLLLSPCPQRLILSAIDFIFLLTLSAFAAVKLYSRFSSPHSSSSSTTKPLLHEKHFEHKVTFLFKLTFLVTTLLLAAYTVLGVLAFTQTSLSSWTVIEALFRLFQAVANMVVVILLVHENKFKASEHPFSLRMYWIGNMVVSCFFAISGRKTWLYKNCELYKKMVSFERIITLFRYCSFCNCGWSEVGA